MPVFSLSDLAKVVLKLLLFAAFIAFIVTLGSWLVGFFSSVYNYIVTAVSGFASQNVPDLLGGLLSVLGLDTFLTSVFAILFSAGAFWLTSVSFVVAYKYGLKLYNASFRVLS